MSRELTPRERLAFPLDYPTLDAAREGAALVRDSVGVVKVGLELFVQAGPKAVSLGADIDCGVFLDLKLHDIPATVDGAVASACALGVRYLTVHAGGGSRMVEAAVERAAKENAGLTILAVTLLTSLDDDDLRAQSIDGTASGHARRLAKLAHGAGARGFVCSTAEVALLRSDLGPDAILVTPGIRMESTSDDQKRVGTPRDAIAAGSSVLVVGRPIRNSPDPSAAARAVLGEIEGGLRDAAAG